MLTNFGRKERKTIKIEGRRGNEIPKKSPNDTFSSSSLFSTAVKTFQTFPMRAEKEQIKKTFPNMKKEEEVSKKCRTNLKHQLDSKSDRHVIRGSAFRKVSCLK